MTSHGIGARDVPEARTDLIEWARVTRGKGADLQRPGFAEFTATTAAHSELYFVNSHMTALARTVGAGLDVYGLSPEDLPSERGFVVWETQASDEPAHAAPVAALWASQGDRMMVTLLVSAQHYGAWAKSKGVQAQSTQLITAGRLTVRGQSPRLELGKPDRSWASLGMGDQEQTVRTLLATWILIRQPADDRKALHAEERVLPSKASAKRIQRIGGNPAQAVRLITLRQGLRSSGDDAAQGHAQRIYRHRWIVQAHRTNQYYPSRGEHQRIWRGPYLVVPAGCEDAPILGGDRVKVLRR